MLPAQLSIGLLVALCSFLIQFLQTTDFLALVALAVILICNICANMCKYGQILLWFILSMHIDRLKKNFWAEEALEGWTWGCLNITLAQKWNSGIFQISAEKSFLARQKSSCTFLYSFGGYNLQKSCGNTSRFIQ